MSNPEQHEIKTKRCWLPVIFGIAFIACGPDASASAEDLVNQVQQFTQSLAIDAHPDATSIEVQVKAPDARLALDGCTHPDISLHGNNQIRSRVLVKIDCPHSLVLHLAVDIVIHKSILTAASSLSRQTQIESGNLRYKEIDILSNSVGRQLLTDFDEAVGKTLKRSVRAGTILTSGMLSEPKMVTRGDSVVIIAKKGGLVVRMPGIAMETGIKGQQIRVKNQSSGRIVKGRIQGPGEVYVLI